MILQQRINKHMRWTQYLKTCLLNVAFVAVLGEMWSVLQRKNS